MIAYLTGELLEVDHDAVILNVNGVGYELLCSQSSIFDFEEQKPVKAFVYTHVREDLIQLFGFATHLEKKVFLSLVKVNGIGPKMALGILSSTRLESLLDFIEQGDAKALSKLPKIGKKKAEQIILTLKGQLKFVETGSQVHHSEPSREMKSALVNLGFKPADVDRVIQDLDPKIGIQEGIRKALSVLGAQV